MNVEKMIDNSDDLSIRVTFMEKNYEYCHNPLKKREIEYISKILQLNAEEVKFLLDDDFKLFNDDDNLNPLVGLKIFIDEIKSAPEYSHLVMYFDVKPGTMLQNLDCIPKGTRIGFYNKHIGEISDFNTKLLRDLKISELKSSIDDDMNMDISPDEFNTHFGYSINEI